MKIYKWFILSIKHITNTKQEECIEYTEYTGGRKYKTLADTDGKVNVIRFTSSSCPDNASFPNRNTGNSAPCTETGFA